MISEARRPFTLLSLHVQLYSFTTIAYYTLHVLGSRIGVQLYDKECSRVKVKESEREEAGNGEEERVGHGDAAVGGGGEQLEHGGGWEGGADVGCIASAGAVLTAKMAKMALAG